MRGHICKHGRSWAVVLYLGRDPATGKKRQKWYSHRTQREAQAHLAQLLVQVQAGGTIPSTRLRLSDFLDQWLRDYAATRVAPTTFQSYQETVRKHLSPALGAMPIARLSAPAIQAYLTGKLKQGLSATTARYHAAILNQALRHAVRWGVLGRNPMDFVDLPRRERKEMRVWDEEQVRIFLGEARKSSTYYVLYLAAVTTGMRQGELLALRWRDADLVRGTVTIQQTFYRLGRRQLFKAPKTSLARRTIHLVPELVEGLRSIREGQLQQRNLWGDSYDDHDLIFCQADGKPLHAHNITQRDFSRTIARASIPRIRFHDLRHCHATYLLRAGVNPKVVQEQLGHATAAFTLSVYSHVLPGMQAEATRILRERLFGNISE